jgi:hypothetical protein
MQACCRYLAIALLRMIVINGDEVKSIYQQLYRH